MDQGFPWKQWATSLAVSFGLTLIIFFISFIIESWIGFRLPWWLWIFVLVTVFTLVQYIMTKRKAQQDNSTVNVVALQ